MSIVSYAQNFEDVMLWRALKDVEYGFYIDVGANDPEIDSITKAFYDSGWRGVNLEPVSQWYEALKRERQRDINLQVAAGSAKGELSFYEIPDSGLSTLNKGIADGHAEKLGCDVITRKVPVRTLSDICEQYYLAPIHFLKIDVEGAERQVLEGIDFQRVRPWIIVVESTLPTTQTEACRDWETLLLESNYTFVYFDGLNRFYVSPEHLELVDKFAVPPNVFDGFSLAGKANNAFTGLQGQRIADLSSDVDFKNEQIEAASKRAEQAEARAQVESERAEQAEARAQAESERAEQAGARVQAESERADQAGAQAKAESERPAEAEAQAHQQFELSVQLEKVHTHLSSAHVELTQTRAKLAESQRQAHQLWLQACAYEQRINALLKSASWRITWPLRKLMSVIRWLFKLPIRLVKVLLRPLASLAVGFVLKRPGFFAKLNSRLKKYPGLHVRLKRFASHRGMLPERFTVVPSTEPPQASAQKIVASGETSSEEVTSPDILASQELELVSEAMSEPPLPETENLDHLTAGARNVYQQLKTAIEVKAV